MEHATLIFALPVTIIAYLVMASFSKVLRMERAEREGHVVRRRATAAHGGAAPEKSWRQRLGQLRAYPSNKAVAQFVERTIHPALVDVKDEFRELGYDAVLTSTPNAKTHIDEHTLVVHMLDHRNFHYQVAAVEAPVPAFGARTMSREVDVYFRLEVFTQTGTEGYDLMGLSKEQVINDVLDRYEAHLSFLQYSSEHDYASMLTPPRPATGMIPQVDADPDGEEGKGKE
jgi:choline/glycine/proline betaine transport protein